MLASAMLCVWILYREWNVQLCGEMAHALFRLEDQPKEWYCEFGKACSLRANRFDLKRHERFFKENGFAWNGKIHVNLFDSKCDQDEMHYAFCCMRQKESIAYIVHVAMRRRAFSSCKNASLLVWGKHQADLEWACFGRIRLGAQNENPAVWRDRRVFIKQFQSARGKRRGEKYERTRPASNRWGENHMASGERAVKKMRKDYGG